MKKIVTFLMVCTGIITHPFANAQTTFRMYDHEMFYGGYSSLADQAADTIVTTPAGAGVRRLKTSLVTKKFSDTELAQIGDRLSMKVLVNAACDNYDRGAHVVMTMISKGDTSYSNPRRIEVARFITPFMDKNKKPDTVGYVFELNHIAMLLKEKSIRDSFDIWCEFEIFGVPSAAWTQISGCGNPNRKDVFYGTMDFTTSGPTATETNNILIPLANKFNINMKKAGQSDAIDVPAKTFTFDLSTKTYFTRAFLITSSHGAGSGGEEYNRRHHYVYVDGTLVYDYLPGFETCEPYRKYNTQANGIYGSSPKSDEAWQSFSNWCPGAYVPTRIIHLGTLDAGTHTIKISIPDAIFPNNDDKIETSLFIQGKNEAFTGLMATNTTVSTIELYPNPASDRIHIETKAVVKDVTVMNAVGKKVLEGSATAINVADLEYGLYYVRVNFENGQYAVKPFIKR
jgi:hypothetical protein